VLSEEPESNFEIVDNDSQSGSGLVEKRPVAGTGQACQSLSDWLTRRQIHHDIKAGA
jgi:hypothetical protein